jgi:hypothetical protein
MTRPAAVLALLATTLLVGVGGYVVGFRQGWRMSIQVERPVRGAISLSLMHGLDNGKLDAIKTSFESDIDNGLLWWPDVERFPAYGSLSALSGEPAVADTITYVRRLATYRRQHESPLNKPEVVSSMLDSVRKTDPAMAAELAAGRGDIDARMAEMIKKYGE